ncbi:MAG: DUF3604 domain-containing protein [Halioglobus sp.]|nr:DUF3604 domain-containing protein [Halioglobus sp.]
MLKKTLLGSLCLILMAAVYLWFNGGDELYAVSRATAPDTAAADYTLQDDSQVAVPPFERGPPTSFNPLKNVYWGELHVHTVESLDAVLFGNTLTIEDAYRFAKGEPLRNNGGELMRLSRPLDFLAITDHAEGFGLRTRCRDEDLGMGDRINCALMETPNIGVFLAIALLAGMDNEPADVGGEAGVYQPVERAKPGYENWPICNDKADPDRCYRDSIADWSRYKLLADQYNEPGVLTTFAGYEFSPVMAGPGKHHRNVIFNGAPLPEHATSSLDVGSAVALWRALEGDCRGDCDFLTIPHNMNKAWGLFYSPWTWDGQAYDEAAWRLRERREPIAEMYQVKGSSECALGVGSTDEECAFSQVLEACRPGQPAGCAFTTSFARQGLRVGLGLQRELGFNPLAFGFIAATDSHNASPGDAEEWDFVGKVASTSSPAIRRMTELPEQEPWESMLRDHTSGGLAGVWAEENTRDAIFSAMKRRETYATSGTRIALRFFAGWGFDAAIVADPDAIAVATRGGVPMGGTLESENMEAGSPTFFAWAQADRMSAGLQRLQVVKGWIDAQGNTHERVRDVACAGDAEVDHDTGRCPQNSAGVNTSDCSLVGDTGAEELRVAWHDPQFDPAHNAFYYVRVLQNPTCRWSTYDALRLNREPPSQVPATIRERAWSSPIWINPS